MDLIKKTKSLSPLTNKEIEAEIYRDGNNVYMVKTDEKGFRYKYLIEKDYELYKELTDLQLKESLLYSHLHLYLTSKCNLNCAVCYEAIDVEEADITLEEIEQFLSHYRGVNVLLSGREPTLREDLEEVIKIVNKRNGAGLLTNGLKIADFNYLKRLKDAGLEKCCFQFYGFNDEIYLKMNGMPTLKQKLKGLENCKKLRIPTTISTTIAKGINEGEIRTIWEYILKNKGFIPQWNVRTAAPVGHHLDTEQHCLSDLLNMIADELHFNKKDILNEYKFFKELAIHFGIGIIHPRICSITFHVKHDHKKGDYPIGKEIDMEKIKRSRFKKIRLLIAGIKAYGFFPVFQYFVLNKIKFKFPVLAGMTRINLRSWPNIYSIDLEEMKKCVTGYYREHQCEKFCTRNILSSNVVKGDYQPKDYSYVEKT